MKRAITCLAITMIASCLIAAEAEKAKETKEESKSTKGNSADFQKPLEKDWQIPEDREKFHVFLLYGQSNMAGGIKKHQPGHLLPEDKIPTPHLVQVANRTLPEKVKNAGWVTIEGLTFVDGNKQVHFDRESYIKLGHRYCDALLKVMNREKQEKKQGLK